MRVAQKANIFFKRDLAKPRILGIMFLVILLVASLWIEQPANAAVVYRSFSTNNNATGSTSLTLTPPAGVQAGDVIIFLVAVRGTGNVITEPASVSLISEMSSGLDLETGVYYRVVTDTEPSYTFSFFNSAKAAISAVAYSGVDTAHPVDAFAAQANAASGTYTAPSITTTVANTKLIGLYSAAVGTSMTQGVGMTMRAQATSSGGGSGGTKVAVGMQDADQAAMGATGSKSATGTSAISSGHLVALRPSPVVSQVSYRFFQNSDSTTAGAPLAAKDTTAAVGAGVPFRLRLNLGVQSDGPNMSAVTGRKFNLQYALKSGGTCGAYGFIKTTTPVRYYDNPTPVNGASYASDVANDPSRAGVTVVGQKYHEDNPLSAAVNTPSGQDALWDIALTTSDTATPGQVYCIRAMQENADLTSSPLTGTYAVTPELTIAQATVSQANYRFFASSDSVTPGLPLATQDTAAATTIDTPFRLRQRLAVGAATLPQSSQSYKLQYAEKVGTCDVGFSGESYADMQSGNSAMKLATTVTDNPTAGSAAWNYGSGEIITLDGTLTGVESPYFGTISSHDAYVTNHGFAIPSNATITGMAVRLHYHISGPISAFSGFRLNPIIGGVKMTGGAERSVYPPLGTGTTDIGGPNELWGQTLTPAIVNASNFGFSVYAFAAYDELGDDFTGAGLYSAQTIIYYELPAGGSGYHQNSSVADLATITNSGNDPTNGARPTVYQSYRETDPFTNNVAAIPAGSDGLWDFALTSTAAADGKTYCFRTVKSDGTPLDSYSQIPEITFSSGGGNGPTTEQKLRGGQSLLNGLKGPFEL